MKARYLRVANFERYQHYKNRRPVWIKVHVALLDSYDLNKLDVPTRLLGMMLLLVAATHDNNIPYDPKYICGKVGMEEESVSEGLETLIAERFLVVSARKHSASRTLAKRSDMASLEKRREREEKPSRGFSKLDPQAEPNPAEQPPATTDAITPNLREVA